METSPPDGRKEETVTQLSRFQKLGKAQASRDLLQGYVSSNSSWREKALCKLPGMRLSRLIPKASSPCCGGLFLNTAAFELPVFLQEAPLKTQCTTLDLDGITSLVCGLNRCLFTSLSHPPQEKAHNQRNPTENRCMTRLTLWVAVLCCLEAMQTSSCPQVQKRVSKSCAITKQRSIALRTHGDMAFLGLSTERAVHSQHPDTPIAAHPGKG